MKSLVMFSIVGAALIAVSGAVMALVYPTPLERRALLIGGVVAFGVQLLAFAIMRLSEGKNVIAGWGLGAILRLVTFAVWVLVIIESFGLPSSAAMVGMAVFLFVSTLVEPLFLKT